MNNDRSKYYSFKPGEKIDGKYWAHSQIGKGAYGTVVKAYNFKEGKDVAIKFFKSGDTFKNIGNDEMHILNIISDYNKHIKYPIISPICSMNWRDHFCIVFPLYNYNLYYSVKKLNGEGYSLPIIKKITTQILECLYFLQHPHLQIIHTDIKPDNVIFINNRSHDIKLIDFGSYLRYPPRQVSYLVQTVYYRSPEVILNLPFSYSVDMWSLGCLLFEIRTGKVLFHESDDDEIMRAILEVLGLPPLDMVINSRLYPRWFKLNDNNSGIASVKKYKRAPIGSRSVESLLKAFKTSHSQRDEEQEEHFLNFIKNCLKYESKKRMTPLQALKHPFINSTKEYSYDIPSEAGKKICTQIGKFGESVSHSEENLCQKMRNLEFNSQIPQSKNSSQDKKMNSTLELNKIDDNSTKYKNKNLQNNGVIIE